MDFFFSDKRRHWKVSSESKVNEIQRCYNLTSGIKKLLFVVE